MTTNEVPTAITSEGLLAKSRVYIRRGFRSKLGKDLDEYQLWASLALEILGKAALAQIHPSLVVDPNHFESLFAAAGRSISTDIKTINASTLYKRLHHLSKQFDTQVKESCDAISLRRNAELHSGELPFHQMKLEAWEGRFWQASEIVAKMLGMSLEEWIGADEALEPKELIAAVAHATLEAAKRRVDQARSHFLATPAAERKAALSESTRKTAAHYPGLFDPLADAHWPTVCPACSGRAFLMGYEYEEEVLDETPGEDGWEEEVRKYYSGEKFRCPTCDLQLEGRAQIEAAGINPDFDDIETRTRDYEPDYGNC